jgi:hypothetical protein
MLPEVISEILHAKGGKIMAIEVFGKEEPGEIE